METGNKMVACRNIGCTAAICLSLASALFPGRTQGAIVINTADHGAGSLRQAIANASPGETITFSITGTITLTSGELLINKSLTILGPGADRLTIQRASASGTPDFRVVHVATGTVRLSGLTVRNGRQTIGAGIFNESTFTLADCVITGNQATQSGGGIENVSTLTMSNCIVRGNSVSASGGNGRGGGLNNEGTVAGLRCTLSSNSVASGSGGGINNNGTLAFTNSVIAGNAAVGNGGGGIFNDGTLTVDTSTIAANTTTAPAGSTGVSRGGGILNDLGTVNLNRSTVSDNLAAGNGGAAGQGGGIANGSGTVRVENSTISGNDVNNGGNGAAIYNAVGSLTVNHTTITANSVFNGSSAQAAGGVFNLSGVVIVKNTILAGNSAFDFFNGQSGDVRSGGFNLIGTTSGPIPSGPSDRLNVTAAALRVSPLRDNGGPTFTHALLCGSPAINSGDNAGAPATDQRGFARIVGGTIDIGAYEDNTTRPGFTCPPGLTLTCAIGPTKIGTLSLNITDTGSQRLMIVWRVNGIAVQTNVVPSSAQRVAQVELTRAFNVGTNQVLVSVTDPGDCVTSCSTTVTVLSRGDLYPIALYHQTIVGVPIGGTLPDIYNGSQHGNFGWLTWTGNPSEPTLATSLTPPGNSQTYINPNNRGDRIVSVGDWVQGRAGVANSSHVRNALNALKQIDITVPVWDRAMGRGNTGLYHVVAFARVRILSYQLPNQNRITARFLGLIDCD